MDTGVKTLAQLSEEGKETKYVTLETGAKISGYTKDYLERLCLLNKVEYRLWSNGNFVIELDSLLRETQAILLSYEGITFVDKNELTDPVPQVVGNILSSVLGGASLGAAVPPLTSYEDSPAFKSGIAQAVPTFGKTISEHSTPVSFIGRAVISDALHPEEKIEKKKESLKGSIPAVAAVPVPAATEPSKKEDAPIHVPIAKFNMNAIHPEAPSSASERSVAEKVHEREHIPVIAVNTHDDWDAQLLGSHLPKKEEAQHIPVTKSEDIAPNIHSTEHIPMHLSIEKAPSTQAGDFAPPQGQKVIVFSDSGVTEHVAPVAAENQNVPPLSPSNTAAPVSLIATAPHVSLPLPSALPLLTATPELNLPPVKTEIPVRAASVLPMATEEHHLTPYETHPLMKSAGFNMVFAALLIASSFVMLGGRVLENIGGKLNTAEYVAGVGAAGGNLPESQAGVPNDDRAALQNGERAMLPFSNEVTATSGERENSIIIRPVFENGPGKSYEYILVPESEVVGTTTPVE